MATISVLSSRLLTKPSLLFLSLCFVSSTVSANSINVSSDHLTQYRNIVDIGLKINPVGESVTLSFELPQKWQLSLDYQQYSDNSTYNRVVNNHVDFSSFGAGVSHSFDELTVAAYYSYSKDEFSSQWGRNRQSEQLDNTKSSSFNASIDYAWDSGNWFFDASLSGQYNRNNNINILSRQVFNEELQANIVETLNQDNDTTNTLVNSSFMVAHLWPLNQQQNIMLGALFSWSYQLSGDEQNTTTSTRAITNTNRTRTRIRHTNISGINNGLNGDDNYGQWVLYGTYDISASWMFELDFSQNIATDNNEHAYSIALSYNF